MEFDETGSRLYLLCFHYEEYSVSGVDVISREWQMETVSMFEYGVTFKVHPSTCV